MQIPSGVIIQPPAQVMRPVANVASPLSPPQNDDQLRAYLQAGAVAIKQTTGVAHQRMSDMIYADLSNYAKANPQSAVAQKALAAAHKSAPEGHSFPGR